MLKQIFAYLQHILPQHGLTLFAGGLAQSRVTWLKNFLITRFIKIYKVDMADARIEAPQAYPTFNDFFIRELKPGIRPITPGEKDIACPADGTVAEIGYIEQNQIFQAKHFYYDLESLLGGNREAAQPFYDGAFATIYLAPCDYHRFHMPISGKLTRTIYVPGKLFSVNRITAECIPNLYARNERLIAFFDTEAGSMAVVMVGAMIVGSIQPVWLDKPVRADSITTTEYPDHPELIKGAELGYFRLGSTLILLYGKDKVDWSSSLQTTFKVKVGQFLGNFSK